MPDWIDSYLKYTANLEPSEQFRKWSAIGAIAAVLQRRVWTLAGHRNLYPNFFIVLVGPSGCGKTTALEPALDILRKTDVPLASDVATRRAFLNKLQEGKQSYLFRDEERIHHSLTVFSAELAVFLGRENWDFFQELSNLYDCPESWEYETANCGKVRLDGVFLNILGAMTPRGVTEILLPTAAGGGIASRCIFIHERKLGNIRVDPSIDFNLQAPLIEGLQHFSTMSGEFKRSKDFIEVMGQWYLRHRAIDFDENPHWAGYQSRKRTHLLKLSMILNVSRFDKTMTLEPEDLLEAINLIEEAEENMFKVFSNPKQPREIIEELMKSIMVKKVIRLVDLYNRHSNIVGKKEMLKHLYALEKIDFCRIEEDRVVYTGKEKK